MVTSTSWPTPLTTGTGQATIARATLSSLKDHRSSSEPPPRTSKMTSQIKSPLDTCLPIRLIALQIAGAASLPCTGTGNNLTGIEGKRRSITLKTSWIAAPVLEVIIAILLGSSGISCLMLSSNRPSPASLTFSCSNWRCRAPSPASSIRSTIS